VALPGCADCVAKRLCSSERAILIQDQAAMRNFYLKIYWPDSIVAHFYSQASPCRLLQQNLPEPNIPTNSIYDRQHHKTGMKSRRSFD
jgi:hypothetical protein